MVSDLRAQLLKQENYLVQISKPLPSLDLHIFVGPEYFQKQLAIERQLEVQAPRQYTRLILIQNLPTDIVALNTATEVDILDLTT